MKKMLTYFIVKCGLQVLKEIQWLLLNKAHENAPLHHVKSGPEIHFIIKVNYSNKPLSIHISIEIVKHCIAKVEKTILLLQKRGLNGQCDMNNRRRSGNGCSKKKGFGC